MVEQQNYRQGLILGAGFLQGFAATGKGSPVSLSFSSFFLLAAFPYGGGCSTTRSQEALPSGVRGTGPRRFVRPYAGQLTSPSFGRRGCRDSSSPIRVHNRGLYLVMGTGPRWGAGPQGGGLSRGHPFGGVRSTCYVLLCMVHCERVLQI